MDAAKVADAQVNRQVRTQITAVPASCVSFFTIQQAQSDMDPHPGQPAGDRMARGVQIG